jgi:hypothetical protein
MDHLRWVIMSKIISNKTAYLFFLLSGLVVSSFIPSAAHAVNPSFCDASPTTVTLIETQIELSDSCQINSDLQIGPGGILLVDYTASPTNVLDIVGNVEMAGDGILLVNGGTFLISQDFAAQRAITMGEDSILVLQNTTMKTNHEPGTASKNLNMYGYGNSIMYVVDSVLDRVENWLLGNYYDNSELIVVNSQHIPTEVYTHDLATVRIFGHDTATEVWLTLEGGITGTIDLPDQTDGVDFAPYSWVMGRGVPGLTGINWRLEIFEAPVKLAIGSHKESSVTVNGLGIPASGEVTIGYFISDGEETISGLKAGVQNIILGSRPPDPPQLTLKNVNLGPVAWQIYSVNGGKARIVNSTVNEVAALHAEISIEDSLLQLAAVAAIGETSSVTITDTEIHSHLIDAFAGGQLKINSSGVYGSILEAVNPNSTVRVDKGIFLPNTPPPGEPCSLSNAIAVDGTILCNPFLPENALVTRNQGVDNFVSCSETVNCTWNP